MYNATNRQREDRQTEYCKNPEADRTKDYSPEISQIINDTFRKGNQVYCTTDWHLWRRDKKGSTSCHKRSDFNKIINTIKDTINDGDLIIHLGDIVDGEFTNEDELKKILIDIPGRKILVRGNNDIFSYNFYRSCGFDYVTRSFTWANNIFTHMPIKNDALVNVHGHIHGYATYWIPYTNQIDVAYMGGRTQLIKLMDVLGNQKKYSKTIKEEPEHFNESTTSLFETVCVEYSQLLNKMHDPYDD